MVRRWLVGRYLAWLEMILDFGAYIAVRWDRDREGDPCVELVFHTYVYSFVLAWQVWVVKPFMTKVIRVDVEEVISSMLG